MTKGCSDKAPITSIKLEPTLLAENEALWTAEYVRRGHGRFGCGAGRGRGSGDTRGW